MSKDIFTTPERPTTPEGWSALEAWLAARDSELEACWAQEYSAVQAPPDATEVRAWMAVFDADAPTRYFRGTRRGSDPVSVDLAGYQETNGAVRQRWITPAVDTDLDAAGARELAAHLIAAADELDELAD
jgi:hypothetical protein